MATTASATSSRRLDDVIQLIPGYDPRAAAGDCYFDRAAAERVLDFFAKCLCHVKGATAGQPFVLQPWQQAILANLFGWKRPDGTRRYRESLVFVPRKNGKTTLIAGLCLYMAACDGEKGAECYSAASTRDQAKLMLAIAKGMVSADTTMSAMFTCYQHAITFGGMNSYRALSADGPSNHGLDVHCAIIDELHAQPDRELVDTLETGTGARTQPLVIHVTTSDYEREGSICNEKHDYASKVRDGIIDDASFLPVIYEASIDDDWKDPAIWRKANPNLGVSVSESYLERQCRKAVDTPTYENTFRRLHLNIRTEQDVRFLSMERWDLAPPIAPELLEGRECFAGVDLASTTDIAAVSLLFPLDEGRYAVIGRYYAPKDNAVRRSRRDRVPYLTWANQGHMTLTDGDVIDYNRIRADLNDMAEAYNIREVSIDRWNSTHLQRDLMDDGLEVVKFGQGFASMSAPTKEFEALVLGSKLMHNACPVLRWMASNVAVEMDAAGNYKPSKKKSTEKIDGIVAAIMALGRAMVAEEAKRSVYEERGIRTL